MDADYKKKKRFWIKSIIFVMIVLVGYVWYQNPQWRYKLTIAQLKEDDYRKYYFFPDEVPDGATEISWKRLPTILQGTGNDVLSFKADQTYLDTVVEAYGKGAAIAVYCESGERGYGDEWYIITEKNTSDNVDGTKEDNDESFYALEGDGEGINYITDISIMNEEVYEQYDVDDLYYFPTWRTLKENKNFDTVVYILHDNGHWNHHSICGFYIIPSENRICFFKE